MTTQVCVEVGIGWPGEKDSTEMDPKNPVVGQLIFDATEFAGYIVDLPPGACQGLLTAREGFGDVCNELLTNQALWGAKAGIVGTETAELVEINGRIERLDAFIPALAKALELLMETRYSLDDRRQRIVFDAALAVERRAGQTPGIAAKYEKTREYRSRAAKKAVKTRMKKAAKAAVKSSADRAGAPRSRS